MRLLGRVIYIYIIIFGPISIGMCWNSALFTSQKNIHRDFWMTGGQKPPDGLFDLGKGLTFLLVSMVFEVPEITGEP